MFFDIQGFTAWSSERQPSQVYMLLEALYGAFDLYASRMKVFKVETVGDSCKYWSLAFGLCQENDSQQSRYNRRGCLWTAARKSPTCNCHVEVRQALFETDEDHYQKIGGLPRTFYGRPTSADWLA